MSEMFDQQYLLSKQYHTSANLNARILLHERFSTNPTNWQRWVFDQFALAPGCQVLELGTGSGQLWLHNLERIPTTWEITLSDFSSGMLQDARENLGPHASRFHFAILDAQTIPYPDNTFACVIANHMLYHVPERSRAFAEISRVLQPQGRLYAATSGETHLREIGLLCEQTGIGVSGIMGSPTQTVFSLQNGAEQMAPWFAPIEIRRLEGNLAVTQVEPLVDFIRSTRAAENINEGQLEALRALINHEIATHGALHITKETGLFIASAIA